jgi:hypothetical protein
MSRRFRWDHGGDPSAAWSDRWRRRWTSSAWDNDLISTPWPSTGRIARWLPQTAHLGARALKYVADWRAAGIALSMCEMAVTATPCCWPWADELSCPPDRSHRRSKSWLTRNDAVIASRRRWAHHRREIEGTSGDADPAGRPDV